MGIFNRVSAALSAAQDAFCEPEEEHELLVRLKRMRGNLEEMQRQFLIVGLSRRRLAEMLTAEQQEAEIWAERVSVALAAGQPELAEEAEALEAAAMDRVASLSDIILSFEDSWEEIVEYLREHQALFLEWHEKVEAVGFDVSDITSPDFPPLEEIQDFVQSHELRAVAQQEVEDALQDAPFGDDRRRTDAERMFKALEAGRSPALN